MTLLCGNIIVLVRLFAIANFFMAQHIAAQSIPTETTATIRGRVLDADTGQPVREKLVVSLAGRVGVSWNTDNLGGFTISKLNIGRYLIKINEPNYRFPIGERVVYLKSADEIVQADIYVRLYGEISGRLVDDDNEAVMGAGVLLVAEEYRSGEKVYVPSQENFTDDRGYYLFDWVPTGKSYHLLAIPLSTNKTEPMMKLSGSDVAAKRQIVTWYPAPPAQASQNELILLSGEKKRVDFAIGSSTSHCVSGKLMSDGHPSAMEFELAIKEVSGYSPANGLSRGQVSSGTSNPKGLFKSCGLSSGEYRLTVGSVLTSYGATSIMVGETDLNDVILNARSPITISGSVELEGGPLNEEKSQIITFMVVSRAQVAFEEIKDRVEVTIPGTFSLTLPAMTTYVVGATGNSHTYLKSAFCGSTILPNKRLDLRESGCDLHLIVGTDTATVRVGVVDQNGKQVQDCEVCMVPTSVQNKDEVAAQSSCSVVDPDADLDSFRLPVGKYYAVTRVQPRLDDWVEDVWQRIGKAFVLDFSQDQPRQITLIAK